MPAAEVDVTPELVAHLIREQRPELLDRSITPLAFGWDNVSFRLGDDLVARFPRREVALPLLENEARWLPELATRLPLPIPAPLFIGAPGGDYPWPWSIVPWIPGESAALADLRPEPAAIALGRFLRALHTPAPPDAPFNPFRGIPLTDRDRATRERIGALGNTIDSAAVVTAWEAALQVTPYDEPARWIHGDLHPHNLLVEDGLLSGVIDFGDVAAGDPATDLAVAWMLFPAPVRLRFSEVYEAGDDALWDRAHGWALSLALAYLANSADNPIMHAIGVTTLERVLEGR